MSMLHMVLSRREGQIMDILYRRGRASAGEVQADLPGNSSSSTVRTQLRVLEDKGHVRHEEHGVRHIYRPVASRHAVRRSALKHLVETFFEGSTEKVVAAMLDGEVAKLSDEQLDRLAGLIAQARKEMKDAKDSKKGGSR